MADFGEQAKVKRDLAARARRLGMSLADGPDRARLERYAAELDEEATELERQDETKP